MNNSHEQLFDLSYLNQIFQGNRQMIDEIISLFLDQVPDYVREMKSCIARNEFSALHPIAHKAKSSISMLGLKRMEAKVLQIEMSSKQNLETDRLPSLVEDLSKEGDEVFSQLKNWLKPDH